MERPVRRMPPEAPQEYGGMVTVAPAMKAFCEKVQRVARTQTSVLVRGESGTGKELVARALHEGSARAKGPYRAVNCATLSGDLLASELFGHVRGAFTGADRERKGLLQLADGGTLFLDEVAELPLDVQARLLRVLQEQVFVPLGGSTPQRVDVRLVSATHTSLRQRVDEGLFREDLMYRIRVVVLFLPPLREREGDLEALTWHFIRTFNRTSPHRAIDGIAADAWDAMQAYRWPGNIRELKNNIEAAFALGEGPTLRLVDLAPELSGVGSPVVETQPVWSDVERERLLAALAAAGGRRAEAAAALGMSRSTLWRKLRKHRLA